MSTSKKELIDAWRKCAGTEGETIPQMFIEGWLAGKNLQEAEVPKPIITPATPALEWMESDGEKYTWTEAMSLGNDGWRLPTRVELIQLYESKLIPSKLCCWSASPYASNANRAWLVYFNYGSDNTNSKSSLYYVRLVREVSGE